jgi:hypothetical protein
VSLHPSANVVISNFESSDPELQVRFVGLNKLSLLSRLDDSPHFPCFDVLIHLPFLEAHSVLAHSVLAHSGLELVLKVGPSF